VPTRQSEWSPMAIFQIVCLTVSNQFIMRFQPGQWTCLQTL